MKITETRLRQVIREEVTARLVEQLVEEEFEKFWQLSPGKQAEEMVKAGVLYD